MRSIEIHVIESDEDLDLGLISGLLEVEDLTDVIACSACQEDLGDAVDDLEFVEFAILLDHERRWFMCIECSAIVLDGADTSNEPLLALLDDDEYEDFDLNN